MNPNTSGGLVPHISSNETTDASVQSEFVNIDMLNVNRSFSGKQYKNNKLHGSSIKNRTSFKYFANIKKDPLDYQATDTVVSDTSLQSDTVLADDEQKVFKTVPVLKDYRYEKLSSSSGENYFVPQSVSMTDSDKEIYSGQINDARNQLIQAEKNQNTNEITSLCSEQDGQIHEFLSGDNFSGRIKVTSQEITSQSNVINSNKKTLHKVPALKVYKNKKLKNYSQRNFNGSQFVCPSEIEQGKLAYTSQVNIASYASNQLMSKANSKSKTITNLLNEQQINTVSLEFAPSQEVFGTTLEFKDEIKGDIEQIMVPDFTTLPSDEVHNKNELCLASDKGSLNLKENKTNNSQNSLIKNIYPLQVNNVLKENELNLNQNDQLKEVIVKLKSATNNSEYAVVLVNVFPQKIKKKDKCKTRPNRTDFKCKKCRINFISESDLNDHVNLSHKTTDLNVSLSESLKCHKCDRVFKGVITYENHLKNKLCDKVKCGKCSRVLKNEFLYQKHLSSRRCMERFKCRICGFCSDSKNEAKEHRRTHKRRRFKQCNTEKNISCSICERKFSTTVRLKAHMIRVHSCRVWLECSLCNQSFETKFALSLHSKVHSKVNSFPLVCSICGKQFKLRNSLLYHRRKHNDKFIHCSKCGKKCVNKTQLNGHMRVHTGERPFKCSECSLSFSLLGNLKRHMEIHSTEKQFQCQVCGQRFYQKQSLASHLKKHDRSGYIYYKNRKCSICRVSLEELSCPLSLHLEEHRKKGEKRPTQSKKRWNQPCQCHICGKVFLQKTNLTLHLYTHTSDKRFKCSICKKDFKYYYNLMRHIKELHNRKQYLCHICGRICSQICVLKMHLRTHTGEKPFQCAICKRDFSDKRSLKRHLNLHSEQRLYECADCGKSFYHKISLINHIQFQHLKHQ